MGVYVGRLKGSEMQRVLEKGGLFYFIHFIK